MQRSAARTPIADLRPATLDIYIWAGDQEPIAFNVTDDATGDPEDLSGAAVIFQARATPASDTALIDLSIGSGITLDGPAGQITVEIPDTASLAGQVLFYDLQITNGGITSTYVAGRLHFERDRSR